MESLTDIAATEAAAAWFAQAAGAVALGDAAPDAQPALLERSAAFGQMAPLLRRDEDEAYRVVEGEVSFFVDGETVPAGPGGVVVAPAGAARTFIVESDVARWTVVTRVSDLQGFLDFGRALAAPPALELPRPAWPSPSELAAVAAIGAANRIELLAPPGVLPDGRASTL
jgi:hypothetical protein